MKLELQWGNYVPKLELGNEGEAPAWERIRAAGVVGG